MNEKTFLEEMKKILDNENIRLDSALADIEEWDSLSILGYVALAVHSCDKNISPAQIRDCATVGDLYALLQ